MLLAALESSKDIASESNQLKANWSKLSKDSGDACEKLAR